MHSICYKGQEAILGTQGLHPRFVGKLCLERVDKEPACHTSPVSESVSWCVTSAKEMGHPCSAVRHPVAV